MCVGQSVRETERKEKKKTGSTEKVRRVLKRKWRGQIELEIKKSTSSFFFTH